MVMFRVCLYFSKSVGRSVHLYFLYKRIIFFISHVIVGPICNNFEKNRAFYDKSMKLGTWLVDNKTKKIKGQCHAENVP